MHFKFLALAALAASASADLADTVNGIPKCALACFAKAADKSGCKTTDFGCLCNVAKLIDIEFQTSLCITDGCSNSDTGSRTGKLCDRWAENPGSAEVAAASSTMSSLIAVATTTTTIKSGAMPTAFAGNQAKLGLVGALAVAAAMHA